VRARGDSGLAQCVWHCTGGPVFLGKRIVFPMLSSCIREKSAASVCLSLWVFPALTLFVALCVQSCFYFSLPLAAPHSPLRLSTSIALYISPWAPCHLYALLR